MRGAIILLVLVLAGPATAERAILALSQEHVGISLTFDGTEIMVYGAIGLGPEGQRPRDPPGVIVTVDGPPALASVRRKEQVAGLWVNRDVARYVPVPSFYSVAATAPLETLISAREDRRHAIGIGARVRSVNVRAAGGDAALFEEALRRIGRRDGRFRLRPAGVELAGGALFRADFSLPATISKGNYIVRVFLTRDGRVIDATRHVFDVRKAPVERFVFQLARENGTLYGFLCVVLAVIAGWGASAVFRLVRQR